MINNDSGRTFETLCRLTSYKLIEVAAQTDEVEEFYSESKLKKLKENVAQLHEIFIKPTDQNVDDATSNQTEEVPVEQRPTWVFDPPQLRDRLFEAAGVKVKHKLNKAQILNKLKKARKQRLAANKQKMKEEERIQSKNQDFIN